MMRARNIIAALLSYTICLSLLTACVGTGVEADSTPYGLTEEKSMVLRLADNQPDGYPTVLGDLKFAELVLERTKGGIVIEVYNDGQLGDEPETIDLLREGRLDFVRVSTAQMAAINPELGVIAMPYLYDDKEHMFKVLDGPIGDRYLEKLTHDNMMGLCWFDAGARSFYNTKREIHTPDDLKGLKIRVQESPLMMDIVKHLGATAYPLSFGDVYDAMEKELVDGAENSFPSYMAWSHNEVAKYYTVDMHTSSPEMIVVNHSLYERMTDKQRKILKECALEAAIYQREEWRRQEDIYRKKAENAGVVITYLTEGEQALFRKAVEPIYRNYPDFSDVVSEIRSMGKSGEE